MALSTKKDFIAEFNRLKKAGYLQGKAGDFKWNDLRSVVFGAQKEEKEGTQSKAKRTQKPVIPPSNAFKHSNGRLYSFRKGRTHVILKGTKYTVSQALRDTEVMNELIKRNHAGLTWT